MTTEHVEAKIVPPSWQAPWTNEQVANLREWQTGPVHPYTCPQERHSWQGKALLIPTNSGWVCDDRECGYTQNWAHPFSLDGSMVASMRKVLDEVGK